MTRTRASKAMAKKTNSVRRSRGRRKFYKTYKSYRNMAYQAYKGYRFIKGIVNAEMKFHDTNHNENADAAGDMYVLNDIGAGDDATQRNGNSILAKYLVIKGAASINADPEAPLQAHVRVILFVDLHGQGSVPTTSQLLTTASVYSQKNIDNTDRFWILSDKLFHVDAYNRSVNINLYRRLDFHCKYSGTGTGTYDSNAIYLFVISDIPGDIVTPYVTFSGRIAYYDN